MHWAERATDPRLDEAFFARLRADQLSAVLKVNAQIAQAAADGGFADYAAFQVHLIEISGFPHADIERTLNGLFGPILSALRRLLAPLLVPSARLTEVTDFAAMTADYNKLRERFMRLGAVARIAPLVTEAAAAGRKRLLDETNAEFAAFSHADASLWRLMQACIEEWNQRMGLHNLGLSQSAALRGVLAVLNDNAKPRLRELSNQVERFVAAMRHEEAGLKFLLSLEQDANPGDPERLRALIKSENEALARVRSEYDKTRSYFDRTLDNLARNCGTL